MNNWVSIIKARQDSGQTVKEWCANNGISINAYYYWLRKLRKAAIELADHPVDPPTQFAKVPTRALQDTSSSIRITRGNTVIEVSNDVSEHLLLFLKEVILAC